jgi:anti-anti-sigma factor
MGQLKIDAIPGKYDSVRILRLSGAFTLQDVFEFQSVIRGLNDPVTVIDLSGVPYMDSASLGSVISFHTSCQRQQRRYALVGMSERIQTLFRVGGVEKILISYPSLDEAQDALTRQSAAP